MNRKATIQEQAPSGTPLRAKYLGKHTVIIITDATDFDIQRMLECIKPNGNMTEGLKQ